MSEAFSFRIDATDGAARTGVIGTAHGTIRTPAFMPVGTAGTVKAMLPESVAATGADCVLGNTYHLMLRPGAERVEALGGLHRFMNWGGPILTDSGGFQVMSLAVLRKLTEKGVEFASHIDGKRHMLTPESSMDIQRRLGSDIVMAFDECTPYPADEETAAASMRRSMRWAERSRAALPERPGHALFGIQQGSVYAGLRAESAERLAAIGFEGYAIGGLAVGEGQSAMFAVLDHAPVQLPADRPRYLMGVGKPADIVGAVVRGVDMFDCVLPTRSGRTGQAFTPAGTRQHRQCAAPGRSTAARRALPLPDLPGVEPCLSPPRLPGGRDHLVHAADLAQPALLPGADGRPARGHRGKQAGGLRGALRCRPRRGRHRAPLAQKRMEPPIERMCALPSS